MPYGGIDLGSSGSTLAQVMACCLTVPMLTYHQCPVVFTWEQFNWKMLKISIIRICCKWHIWITTISLRGQWVIDVHEKLVQWINVSLGTVIILFLWSHVIFCSHTQKFIFVSCFLLFKGFVFSFSNNNHTVQYKCTGCMCIEWNQTKLLTFNCNWYHCFHLVQWWVSLSIWILLGGSNGLWDSFGFVPCINCHHHHVYLRVTHFGLNQTAKHGWLKPPEEWIIKGYWLVEARWHIYVLVN